MLLARLNHTVMTLNINFVLQDDIFGLSGVIYAEEREKQDHQRDTGLCFLLLVEW